MNFTAHNIVFADGTCTRPGHPPLESGGIFQAALRTLKLFTNPGATVADLGCLEGGYTAGFARAGYHTTGIEARTPNMAKCEHVADRLNLPNLRFTRADVRDLNEPYDAVFACGILYHLDEPVRFLHRLGELTPVLILQTHFSPHPSDVNEGARGHWFPETPAEDKVWSAYRNDRSFWLAKPDLLQALRDAGYTYIAEQYDFLDDIATAAYPGEPCPVPDRGMFTAVKT